MTAVVGYLLVFLARVTDVSLGTMRMLMLVRGRRAWAALLGLFEVSVYVMALSRVMSNLSNPLQLAAYAAGYATGNFVGSLIEEWMALGYLSVQAIPTSLETADRLAQTLRQRGFGVTTVDGQGREGPKKILHISLARKALPGLLRDIDGSDPDAFVTVLDTRHRVGGVFAAKMGK
ncbi:MAG: DUF2179 domain-containing protein [Chloroflexota bacterium]